jgi:anthranilate/para-aminobenzoate synthase component I
MEGPRSPEEAARSLRGHGAFWLGGLVAQEPAQAPQHTGRFSYFGVDPVEERVLPRGAPAADAASWWRALPPPPNRAGESAAHGLRVPEWVGFVSYDAGVRVDAAATVDPAATARTTTPLLWFGRYDAVLIYDAVERRWLVAAETDAAADALAARVKTGGAAPQASVGPATASDAPSHLRAIHEALEHIAAGDIYQINLARRWTATFAGEPLALAEAMAAASPVPLGFYLATEPWALVVRTMETFFDWRRGRIVTRPIKGTIASSPQTAEAQADALRTNEKERAEHVMIVDLMRNDLGRVAKAGTVRVDEIMGVEPYARLSHLVSTISADTGDGVTLVEIFRALFPPGSVTGTPKTRAVELIGELEPHPRGAYTGAVGFVDRDGDATFAVAIRAAEIANGRATYFAGGGIVEASDPSLEVAETELKARVFVDALARIAANDTVASDPHGG